MIPFSGWFQSHIRAYWKICQILQVSWTFNRLMQDGCSPLLITPFSYLYLTRIELKTLIWVWKRLERPQKQAPARLPISTKEGSLFRPLRQWIRLSSNPEGIRFLSQQGALISLKIYYFGAICLHLQAVQTSCFPPHPPPPYPRLLKAPC